MNPLILPQIVQSSQAKRNDQKIANEFVEALRFALTPEQFIEMQTRNAQAEYLHDICASHEFCDANMVMAEAFRCIMQREVRLNNQRDIDLWNRSWELAKKQGLTAI